jgi:hypothetical protein
VVNVEDQMRLQTIALFGFVALVCALVIGVSSRGATSVKTSIHHPIDISALTKAAKNLPEQAFPAH